MRCSLIIDADFCAELESAYLWTAAFQWMRKMKPAQRVAGLENVSQSATSKMEGLKISWRMGSAGTNTKRLDQGQVIHLEMISNHGNSEDHVTKRHDNIWWREITVWIRTAQKHAKDQRNERYRGRGLKKLRKSWTKSCDMLLTNSV